ncbi:ABC transporter substrate-binding protein [Photobacterium leiognathi]|uniref:ABC transporter substrate-binding protein n=1 Tax=Photobacterium leiognathi TaxID=553611 RepID=UPI0029822693|nr:ABC transporter substrate-binding protein [Photobacterium leiognathi]
MKTRFKLLTLAMGVMASCSALAGDYPMTITDVSGQTITLDHQPQHIALGTARNFPLLEIVYGKDAGKHVIAMRDDMKISAPSMYEFYTKKYPNLKTVPEIGKISKGQFDAESFIQMQPKPDVLIIGTSSMNSAKEKGLVKKLNDAGIQVITADFREQTIKNTMTSVTSVAKALGHEERGKAFADYYTKHLNVITDRIAKAKDLKPKTVFMETAAGYTLDSCCNTYAGGNMDDFITLLKATNIATKPLGGAHSGNMSPETIVAENPDVYIMQTAGWVNKKGHSSKGIPLGYAPNDDAIKAATTTLMDRSWLQATNANLTGNVFSIYKPFYNSPYNLVALEHFAQWIRPELFKDLNPEQTFVEMNKILADSDVSGLFGINNVEVIK